MRPNETILQRNQRVFGTDRPVALVTGSVAARVGRVIAEHLFVQNFQLILHGHRSREIAVDGMLEPAMTVFGAVEDEQNVVEWRTRVEEKLGRIDVLVNSAAVWNPKPLEATTAEDFENSFRINALGTALTCKSFGLWMASQSHGGAIVNIGDWAIERPYRDFAAYFPSKAAVTTITQSMAVELATRNPKVRVNAILPGPVMLAESITAERRQRIVDESLLQREGTAADVADAVEYLATSPFVTGTCLPVDGGRTIYAGPSADPIAHPNVQ